MIIGGVAGAVLGSLMSSAIDEGILRKIFGAVLIVSALISLTKCVIMLKNRNNGK